MSIHRSFPEGFLWGSAGAAHQTEGDNTNSDWWAHEHKRKTNATEKSLGACDSYHRFAEDWRLVADSGQNAVRLSIEWARIEPSPGEFSSEELDHYREVIGTARDLGLTTSVTLHHFTNPNWFAKRGGWDSDEAVDVFGRFVRRAADALGDLLQIVNTINEPSVVAVVGHLMGFFPPRVNDVQATHRVTVNLLKAHAAAAEAVRGSSDALIGLPLSVLDFFPTEDTALGWRARDFMHWSWVGVWLEALRTGAVRGLSVPDETIAGLGRNDDFIGIQYYSRFDVHPAALQAAGSAADAVPNPIGARPALPGADADERRTQMGWLWHPAGLGTVIDEVAEATGLPIQITENGIATADDGERIEFVRLHLEQVHDAIARGRDVRGYFYWSTLDNFEWNDGYRPTFGLVAVDRRTMERSPKPSLAWFGNVARTNRLA
jgi:beta-glucosidase